MENKLKSFINPNIKKGDIVRLIDGSGLSCDKFNEEIYIPLAYPQLTNSNEVLKDLDFEVIETKIKNRISKRYEIIFSSISYVLDIKIKYNNLILRTCSNFVKKIN